MSMVEQASEGERRVSLGEGKQSLIPDSSSTFPRCAVKLCAPLIGGSSNLFPSFLGNPFLLMPQISSADASRDSSHDKAIALHPNDEAP